MTRLTTLRSRLSDLRRRRQTVRWGTGYAALVLAVLWALALAFVVDWTFELSKPARALTLLLCGAAVVWTFRRFTLPQLGHHETDLDMALMVERQQKIDSDLVAALQFESQEAPGWGSVQLQHAVIDYVAEFGKGWNVFEGFTRQVLVRRAAAVTATVALLGVAAALYPQHAAAFLNRFFLGSAHYPSRTHLDELLVAGKSLPLPTSADTVVKTAYGRPLRFEIHASGELPESGRVELQNAAHTSSTSVDLHPLEADPAAPQAASGTKTYVGDLPKLVDSLFFQVYLGDAWTDPAELRVIELPVVEPKLIPVAPHYAKDVDPASEALPGARQISIIEGSEVGVELRCANKQLSEAHLTIDGKSYPLADVSSADQPGRLWRLKTEGSPLARVDKPTHYELQVTDIDDLQLEQPIQGFIRIKADQRPRVSAEVVTRFVLPSASPRIDYRASDDFGLSKLLIHLQISGGEGSETREKTLEVVHLDEPLLRDQLPLRSSYKLDLAPLGLKKGDMVKVTLEAVDYRGAVAGMSSTSEALTLQVTDESGILAAISESDERSARQLDAIIKRQLGIGGSK